MKFKANYMSFTIHANIEREDGSICRTGTHGQSINGLYKSVLSFGHGEKKIRCFDILGELHFDIGPHSSTITTISRRFVFGEIAAIDDVLKLEKTNKPNPVLECFSASYLSEMKERGGFTHVYSADYMGYQWEFASPGKVVLKDRESLTPILWVPNPPRSIDNPKRPRGGITDPKILAHLKF
jgi:hypothetical protein